MHEIFVDTRIELLTFGCVLRIKFDEIVRFLRGRSIAHANKIVRAFARVRAIARLKHKGQVSKNIQDKNFSYTAVLQIVLF